MAQRFGKWNGDWNSSTWASARGLWKKPSPEEEKSDHDTWCEAACEDGGFLRVLWCELCQLISDILPHRSPAEPPAPSPEQAEG